MLGAFAHFIVLAWSGGSESADDHGKPVLGAFAHFIVTSWARADSDPPLHALRGALEVIVEILRRFHHPLGQQGLDLPDAIPARLESVLVRLKQGKPLRMQSAGSPDSVIRTEASVVTLTLLADLQGIPFSRNGLRAETESGRVADRWHQKATSRSGRPLSWIESSAKRLNRRLIS